MLEEFLLDLRKCNCGGLSRWRLSKSDFQGWASSKAENGIRKQKAIKWGM